MQSFKHVTERLFNYSISSTIFEQLPVQTLENLSFQPTKVSNKLPLCKFQINKQLNTWLDKKLSDFVRMTFYKYTESSELKSLPIKSIECNRIWPLLLEQLNISHVNSIESLQKREKCSRKINLDEFSALYFSKIDKRKIANQSMLEKGQINLNLNEFTKTNLFVSKMIRIKQITESSKAYQNNTTTYLMNYTLGNQCHEEWQYSKLNITLINPSLNIMNKFLKNHQKNCYLIEELTTVQEENLFFIRPKAIVLSNSSLETLLSTITLLHLVYYMACGSKLNQFEPQMTGQAHEEYYLRVMKQIYASMGSKFPIKIITTKQIYLKYLQLFSFIKILASFIDQENKPSQNFPQSKLSEESLSELQKRYEKYEQKQYFDLKARTHFILCQYHFHVIEAENHFSYNNYQLCFRDHNLFPYPTYDLQVYDLSTGQFVLSLYQKFLSNVKSIYYLSKKQFISEQKYLSIVKRLEQKEDQTKNYPHFLILTSPLSENFENQAKVGSKLQIILKNLPIKQKFSNIHRIKKETLLVNNIKIEKNKAKIFNDPYGINVSRKNLLFQIVRRIQLFALLSDCNILTILNNSIEVQLKEGQVLYNPIMKFDYLYIVIDGVCSLSNGKQANQKMQFITIGDLFGWNHLLFSQQFLAKQDQIKDWKTQEHQYIVKAFSKQTTLLRVQLQFLACLLFVIYHDITQPYSNVSDPQDSLNFSVSHSETERLLVDILKDKPRSGFGDNGYLLQILKTKKTIKKLENARSYYSSLQSSLNFIDDSQNIPLKLFFINYPNLALAF